MSSDAPMDKLELPPIATKHDKSDPDIVLDAGDSGTDVDPHIKVMDCSTWEQSDQVSMTQSHECVNLDSKPPPLESHGFLEYNSLIFIAGVFCTCIGLILHAVGISTPNWSVAQLYDNETIDTNLTITAVFGLRDSVLSEGWGNHCTQHLPCGLVGKGKYEQARADADHTAHIAGYFTGCAACIGLFSLIAGNKVTRARFQAFSQGAVLAFGGVGVVLTVLTLLIWFNSIHAELKGMAETCVGYSFILSLSGAFFTLLGFALFLGFRRKPTHINFSAVEGVKPECSD